MGHITVSAIVAMAQNGVIGRDNALIWHLPADLQHFKHTTMGKPMIMGRKSFESLGKPLPGRPHIVISRTEGGQAPPQEGVFWVKTIDEALSRARTLAAEGGKDEIFITGGGEIYRQTLPIIERLYLTVLARDYEGDTVFPAIDWSTWKVVSEDAHPAEPEKDRPPFTIYTLERG